MAEFGLQVHPGGEISISSSGVFLLAQEGEDCCCTRGPQTLYQIINDCCTGEAWYVADAALAGFNCRTLLYQGRCYSFIRTRPFPRSAIPQGSVILETLPGAVCSPDECGRGVCAVPCPDACCVQQFLPRCDSNPWTQCCKLGRTAEVVYVYRRVRTEMNRAGATVPTSQCPGAIPCPGNPGTGVLLGPERNYSEVEVLRTRVRFECVHNSATCLEFSYNNERHGFKVGTVTVDNCTVTDVPQFYDDVTRQEGCQNAPYIGVPIPTYRFIDGSNTPQCRVDVSEPGVEFHGDIVQTCLNGRMRTTLRQIGGICGQVTADWYEEETWTYEVSPGDPCPPGAGDCGLLLVPGARPGDLGRPIGGRGKSSGAAVLSPLAGLAPRRLKARDLA